MRADKSFVCVCVCVCVCGGGGGYELIWGYFLQSTKDLR